jgi:hypothetical protein
VKCTCTAELQCTQCCRGLTLPAARRPCGRWVSRKQVGVYVMGKGIPNCLRARDAHTHWAVALDSCTTTTNIVMQRSSRHWKMYVTHIYTLHFMSDEACTCACLLCFESTFGHTHKPHQHLAGMNGDQNTDWNTLQVCDIAHCVLIS